MVEITPTESLPDGEELDVQLFRLVTLDRSTEWRAHAGRLTVGSHEGNDVVLDDSLNGVSRFHAEIRPEGNSYVIVDLNSRNGVWINGRKIKDKAPLSLGVPATVGGVGNAEQRRVGYRAFADQVSGRQLCIGRHQ
jgi:hypothetical protein